MFSVIHSHWRLVGRVIGQCIKCQVLNAIVHTVENINVEVLKVTPIIRFPAESVTYKRYFVCIVSENLFLIVVQQILLVMNVIMNSLMWYNFFSIAMLYELIRLLFVTFSSELTLWMQLARVECDHNHCASFSIHFPTVTWHWSPLASPSCAHTTYLTYSVLFCRKQEKFSEI